MNDDAPFNPPLRAHEARRIIQNVLARGHTITFIPHAYQAMDDDGLEEIDCVNVLRGGQVDEAEWENGGWRHHVRTSRICLIVEFRSPTQVVVITVWRLGR